MSSSDQSQHRFNCHNETTSNNWRFTPPHSCYILGACLTFGSSESQLGDYQKTNWGLNSSHPLQLMQNTQRSEFGSNNFFPKCLALLLVAICQFCDSLGSQPHSAISIGTSLLEGMTCSATSLPRPNKIGKSQPLAEESRVNPGMLQVCIRLMHKHKNVIWTKQSTSFVWSPNLTILASIKQLIHHVQSNAILKSKI